MKGIVPAIAAVAVVILVILVVVTTTNQPSFETKQVEAPPPASTIGNLDGTSVQADDYEAPDDRKVRGGGGGY